MPKSDEPSQSELCEIGRRLCALLQLKPREPISAATLRCIVSERGPDVPSERLGVLLSLRACADAPAVHELPPEVRELRDAVDGYAEVLRHSFKQRERVVVAAAVAFPHLEIMATEREEALDFARSDKDRAAGRTGSIWPSPGSLRDVPQALAGHLALDEPLVSCASKVLHDLSLTNSHPDIVTHFGPTRTRMAKALSDAGYSPAEIASITEPLKKSGPARENARNAVQRRLESKSDDYLYPVIPIDTNAPDAQEKIAKLKPAADFVAGLGRDVVVYVSAPFESAIDPEGTVNQ